MPRILVVEDDPEIARVIVAKLREHDHDVLHLHNGRDALARTREERFDAITLDRMLPGMDGLELVGRLRDTQNALAPEHDRGAPQSSEMGPGYAEMVRERDIAEAIIDGEIEPYLQPIVDLGEGTILGYESLARWRSERLGLMRPFDFLPLARRTGLIRRIDLTMADRAMAIAARLGDREDSPFVSINF